MTASEAHSGLIAPHPYERQVLANVGNRYVVFGSKVRMHGPRLLGPDDVRARFTERVGDETDFPPERLIRSIQIKDAEVCHEFSEGPPASNLRIVFPDSVVVTAAVSVGTRDFKGTELERCWKELFELSRGPGPQHEVWNFNVERLRLSILYFDGNVPHHCDLDPLYVWEFNDDGSVFDRTDLDMRLDDWQQRIAAIYAQAEAWGAREGLTADRSRTILMSEDLMQKFAIPDRELAILDLSRGESPVMSIVPAGLWVIGSNGRIDIITHERSAILLDTSRDISITRWVYIIRGERREARPWDETAFRDLIGVEVHA
ncbi:hypothetical protein MKK75_26340 [Methylobacterium sp. J-030]|uniref:hypothetical protein n=1 Tax=Methylobacterium sp. J-030 TaxID=2836627 RepID=UPI001FB9ABD3|nr:hypothetical protein [Methylobacterium sp. J-030]MCJ2072269.1 hypothetical protein [Methylobacterium sp. J-030]